MSNLVEFKLSDLLTAAENLGWITEVVAKNFPAREDTTLNNEGELEVLYIGAYCNVHLTIHTGAGEPVIFRQSYIKEFGPKYWMFHTNTTNTQNHRNIITLQRLGIPYSTV